MARLAPLLAEHFTVISYDRRGRGDSGDTAPYAKEREVEDLEALIKEAGGSALMFGMSSGAILALEAAARGLAIKKLALYEPPFVGNDSHYRPLDYFAQLKKLIAANRRGDAVKLFMTMVGMPAVLVAIIRLTPMWSKLKALAPTLIYDATIMGDGLLPTERLASVTAPTMVIDGGKGPAGMHDAAQALADVLPNAQHHTLEGQTHDPNPKVLAPVLEEFFAI